MVLFVCAAEKSFVGEGGRGGEITIEMYNLYARAPPGCPTHIILSGPPEELCAYHLSTLHFGFFGNLLFSLPIAAMRQEWVDDTQVRYWFPFERFAPTLFVSRKYAFWRLPRHWEFSEVSLEVVTNPTFELLQTSHWEHTIKQCWYDDPTPIQRPYIFDHANLKGLVVVGNRKLPLKIENSSGMMRTAEWIDAHCTSIAANVWYIPFFDGAGSWHDNGHIVQESTHCVVYLPDTFRGDLFGVQSWLTDPTNVPEQRQYSIPYHIGRLSTTYRTWLRDLNDDGEYSTVCKHDYWAPLARERQETESCWLAIMALSQAGIFPELVRAVISWLAISQLKWIPPNLTSLRKL